MTRDLLMCVDDDFCLSFRHDGQCQIVASHQAVATQNQIGAAGV